jgi:hypothetical protein
MQDIKSLILFMFTAALIITAVLVFFLFRTAIIT